MDREALTHFFTIYFAILIISFPVGIIISAVVKLYKLLLDPERITRKKFLFICKMEDRNEKEQTKRAVKEFIKQYEEEHGLIWDDQAGEYK